MSCLRVSDIDFQFYRSLAMDKSQKRGGENIYIYIYIFYQYVILLNVVLFLRRVSRRFELEIFLKPVLFRGPPSIQEVCTFVL